MRTARSHCVDLSPTYLRLACGRRRCVPTNYFLTFAVFNTHEDILCNHSCNQLWKFPPLLKSTIRFGTWREDVLTLARGNGSHLLECLSGWKWRRRVLVYNANIMCILLTQYSIESFIVIFTRTKASQSVLIFLGWFTRIMPIENNIFFPLVNEYSDNMCQTWKND